jgi:hypothetical protein
MGRGRALVWDWLTAAGGLVLIVSLFLPWYFSNGENWTGSSAFGKTDKLVLLAGLVSLALPVVAALKPRNQDVQKYAFVVFAIVALCLLVVIIRVANPPEFDSLDAPVTHKVGSWLAIASLVGCALFTALGMRERLARRGAHAPA